MVAPPFEDLIENAGFALPDPEPVMIGAVYPWDATPAEIRGLARACTAHGLGPPLSQKEFVELLMRATWNDRAALVAFHLPREIGRLSLLSDRAARKPGRGGIGMTLATVPGDPWRRQRLCENGEIEDPAWPRIVFSAIDAKRCRIWFKPVTPPYWGGVFVSLQCVAEALGAGECENVRDACEAFGIEYENGALGSAFTQALAAIRAESRLYVTLLEHHVELCPDEPPTAYASAGTYAKALLRRTGIRPPMRRFPRFPQEVSAACMAAFFGGEVRAHVRGAKLPAQLLDFGGAYGIAGSLIGAWDVLSAEEVLVEEVSAIEAAALLERFTSEFRAYIEGGPPPSEEAWRAAWLIAYVSPEATVLPHRPRQGETWSTVRAPLTYGKGALPWFAPDLIVHLLEGGPIPKIERAIRLVGKGRVGLRHVTLPTGRVVDPSREDLVRILVDERLRVRRDPSLSRSERRRLRRLLKNISVGLLTGLTVQINDDEPTKTPREVRAFDPRTGAEAAHWVPVLETPGDWYFPLVAAAITSTARLLLHLVIEMVHAQGGIVAYWDTDSVLVVALPEGGLVACPGGPERLSDGHAAVRALSFREIAQVRWRIEELLPVSDELRPYVDAIGPDGEWARFPQPSRLELEKENFDGPRGFPTTLYAVVRAAKKYHLYIAEETGPHVQVVGGKGVVIQPTPEQLARPHNVRVTKTSKHGLPYEAPDGSSLWIEHGIEGRLRIEWEMPIEKADSSLDHPAVTYVPAARPDILRMHPQARPFSTLAVANLPSGEQVVAPIHRSFEPVGADWRNADGDQARMTVQGRWLARTLGDALARAWSGSDRRTITPDGWPIGPGTEGVVIPLRSVASSLRIIGKESRHLGIGRGVLHGAEFSHYGGDEVLPDVREAARRLAKEAGIREKLMDLAGVGERAFAYWLSGGRDPRPDRLAALVSVVAALAREKLLVAEPLAPVPETDEDTIAAFLGLPEPDRRCQHCGKSLTGRAKKWCPGDACRKRFERSAQGRFG